MSIKLKVLVGDGRDFMMIGSSDMSIANLAEAIEAEYNELFGSESSHRLHVAKMQDGDGAFLPFKFYVGDLLHDGSVVKVLAGKGNLRGSNSSKGQKSVGMSPVRRAGGRASKVDVVLQTWRANQMDIASMLGEIQSADAGVMCERFAENDGLGYGMLFSFARSPDSEVRRQCALTLKIMAEAASSDGFAFFSTTFLETAVALLSQEDETDIHVMTMESLLRLVETDNPDHGRFLCKYTNFLFVLDDISNSTVPALAHCGNLILSSLMASDDCQERISAVYGPQRTNEMLKAAYSKGPMSQSSDGRGLSSVRAAPIVGGDPQDQIQAFLEAATSQHERMQKTAVATAVAWCRDNTAKQLLHSKAMEALCKLLQVPNVSWQIDILNCLHKLSSFESRTPARDGKNCIISGRGIDSLSTVAHSKDEEVVLLTVQLLGILAVASDLQKVFSKFPDLLRRMISLAKSGDEDIARNSIKCLGHLSSNSDVKKRLSALPELATLFSNKSELPQDSLSCMYLDKLRILVKR